MISAALAIWSMGRLSRTDLSSATYLDRLSPELSNVRHPFPATSAGEVRREFVSKTPGDIPSRPRAPTAGSVEYSNTSKHSCADAVSFRQTDSGRYHLPSVRLRWRWPRR